MSFGAPVWFWAFGALPVLVALFFANERRRSGLLARLVAARLAPRLAGNVSIGKRRLRFLLLLLGLAALIIALAQPRYGFTWEQTKRKGRDVILAIDTSRSMLANDLAPNRLTRAKLAAQDLLAELQGDRVGLVAFAGTSFLQAPLTIDYGAVRNALNELDTEIIPEGGSNLAEMIRTAREAFGKGESDNRALIVFSDGEELDTDGIRAATELNREIRIFTVGLGSPEGALIPLAARGRSTEFVKDASGQIVKSRLDEDRLRKIAESTGGFYVRLETGRPEMNQIVREGLAKMTEQEIDARLSRQPIERYQWPLSAALAILASSLLIGERRRGPSLRPSVAALMVGLIAISAEAKNRGVEAYERHDFPNALREFSEQLKLQPESPELHFNRGSAAYKTGDLEQALSAFSKAVTSPDPGVRARAAYNMGNTLFQRGLKQQEKEAKIQEWKNALQQYEEALKVDPKDADTIYNRDLVRRLLEELEKEPPKDDQQQPPKQDQDQQNKDQQKKDQQQNEQSQPDQQKKEQNETGKGQDQQPSQPKDGKGDKDSQPQQPEASQQNGDKGKEDQKPNDGGKKEQADASKPQDQGGPGEKGQQPEGKGNLQPQSGESQDSPKAGEKPEEMPDQPSGKKEGELKPAQSAGGETRDDAQSQEAAEAAAAAEGKMTEQQAKALLDSLKGEDQKVRLVDPQKRQKPNRTLKDW